MGNKEFKGCPLACKDLGFCLGISDLLSNLTLIQTGDKSIKGLSFSASEVVKNFKERGCACSEQLEALAKQFPQKYK